MRSLVSSRLPRHVVDCRAVRVADTRYWQPLLVPVKRSFVTSAQCRVRNTPLPCPSPHLLRDPGLTTHSQPEARSPLVELGQARPGRIYSKGLATVTSETKYDAVIVGAGPAGITVLGNFLERGLGSILWVDDIFTAGRINRAYREVPSNTKTKLFIDFAEAVSPFRDIIQNNGSPNPVDALRKLQQDKGCKLGEAADVLLMLTEGLIKHPSVKAATGKVSAARLGSTQKWIVSVDSPHHGQFPSMATTDRLVLCTGSSPTETVLPVQIDGIRPLNLDTALSPSILARKINSASPCTIAVIGASHSAILVLLNLCTLAQTSHPHLRIKWLTRHPLRYAEFMDGWMLRDNTGLKGEAADWARANLEPAVFESSRVKDVIAKIQHDRGDEIAAYKTHLPGCEYYVQAIGYTRDPLPGLLVQDHATNQAEPLVPFYNHLDGSFSRGREEGERVPGLYGAGIAWPERVTDPHGNVEYAVGFWKFMKFVKRVSPEWN